VKLAERIDGGIVHVDVEDVVVIQRVALAADRGLRLGVC
jgi:hypothetical protein